MVTYFVKVVAAKMTEVDRLDTMCKETRLSEGLDWEDEERGQVVSWFLAQGIRNIEPLDEKQRTKEHADHISWSQEL